MSSRDNDTAPVIAMIVIAVLVVGWLIIKSIADTIGASPKATFHFLLWMVAAAAIAIPAVLFSIVRPRTAFLGWLAICTLCSHDLLGSIANNGMSLDDPLLWRIETTWYSSRVTIGLVSAALAAAAVWSWRDDNRW